jgi:hypothetical protein
MNRAATRLESLLLGAARRCLPRHRRDWAEAMQAEASYLPARERLRWAFGCLVGAIKTRISSMETGTFRINRWVMLLEMLGCFGPSTLAWWVFTFGPAGLVRLDSQTLDKVFLSVPGGGWFFAAWLGFGLSGLVGLVGLAFGLRYVFTGRSLRNRMLGYALIAVPVLQSVMGAVSTQWSTQGGDLAARVNLFVLLTLLPVIGLAHLLYLAKPADPPATAAGLAAA